jgi:transposase-like protein
MSDLGRLDPEVVPQARRRMFSAKHKLRILQKADACTEPGQIGALLRREGLYSSTLTNWRRQREEGSLKGLAPKKQGPRPDPDQELLKRMAKLEKENLRLADKLEKAELIIDVQKKVARLLGAEQPEDRDGRK